MACSLSSLVFSFQFYGKQKTQPILHYSLNHKANNQTVTVFSRAYVVSFYISSKLMEKQSNTKSKLKDEYDYTFSLVIIFTKQT